MKIVFFIYKFKIASKRLHFCDQTGSSLLRNNQVDHFFIYLKLCFALNPFQGA